MNLDKKALAGFIKEVEDSRDRQKGETDFQRDVFKRAKEKHFDVKALRIVLQRRAIDASRRDEQDYNVQAYEHALGGKKAAMEALENGATVREAAAAGGISTGAAGNLAKVVQNSPFVDTEVEAGAPSPVRDGEASADERDASASSSPPLPADGVRITSECTPACTFDPPAPAEEIDLTLPPFLDRRAAA